MSDRPNFLMIVVDQQRADWLSCYGHPVIKSPHIDSLAKEGLRFDEFHTASPVCMPNRASILTGRYPSIHGLRYNGCALSSRANTFVDVLKLSGYQTAAIGKSHLQPFSSNDAPRPKGEEDKYNSDLPEAWKDGYEPYIHEEPGRYESADEYDFPTPYYGFDYIDMVTSHGVECGGHYLQWLRKQTPDWKLLSDPNHQFEHDYTCPQACRTKMPEELYPTRYIENQVVDWLKNGRDEQKPFFLFASFPDPHHPFNPPGKYWNSYSPEQFEIPVSSADINPIPKTLQYALNQLEAGEYPSTPQEAFAATDQEVREAMALTGGMIHMIDDAVGNILDTLKAEGLDDNTVVIFTSDHGDYLGDSNLLLKGPWIRKSIHRVPFIWKDPDDSVHGETDVLGSAVDIAPTILARAGLKPYFGIQGRDLLKDKERGEGRSHLLIEHNDNVARMGLESASRSRTIYSHQARLTLYAGDDWGELFDLKNDPLETRNLWSEPEYQSLKLELIEKLAEQLAQTMDESPRAIRRA